MLNNLLLLDEVGTAERARINFVDLVGFEPEVDVDALGEVERATSGQQSLETTPESLYYVGM